MSDRRSRIASSLESQQSRLTKAKAAVARSRAALSALDRKRDTRRKIIAGGAALAEASANPDFAAALQGVLARRVTADRNRELFELDGPASPPPSGAIPGWHPVKLPDGTWGSAAAASDSLPPELVGRRIIVTDRAGRSWTATVLEVVGRQGDRILVRDSGRPRNGA